MIDPTQEVVVAVINKGPAPHEHAKAMRRLAEDWPRLARALTHLIQREGQIVPLEWRHLT